jgi:probable rRNA maturation factor
LILNRQRRVSVSLAALKKFAERACRKLRLPSEALTICLVTNAEMTKWNRAYRGKKSPTDVLSFAAEETGPGLKKRGRQRRRGERPPFDFVGSPTSRASYLGDIAIAPAVARRNARRYGRKFGDEMRTLILHGMLHLMGYDHETDSGQMNRRERRLRRELGLA